MCVNISQSGEEPLVQLLNVRYLCGSRWIRLLPEARSGSEQLGPGLKKQNFCPTLGGNVKIKSGTEINKGYLKSD